MDFRIPDWLHYEIARRWERLAIRQRINEHPKIVIGITTASVLLLLIIVIGLSLPEKAVEVEEEYEKAWFYDLNTGKLFVAKSDKLPPIDAPSGPLPNGQPAGVKAYVFSYTYEPNETTRFIGFLETLTPEAKKYMSAFRKSRDSVTKEAIRKCNQGRLVRRVYDEQWLSADSDQAQAILTELSLPDENGQIPVYCPPE